MLGYVTLGANDYDAALKFYDTLFAEFGGKRVFNSDRIQFYGSPNGGMVAICKPYDGEPAAKGNGTMVALAATSKEQVDKVHATAIANGATCDGPPGQRLPTFYGAYFRDADGNKLCVYKMG